MHFYYVPNPNLPNGLRVNIDEWTLDHGNTNMFRYLRTAYPKRHRLEQLFDTLEKDDTLEQVRSFILTGYDDAKPFSYKEVFALENQQFRAIVFGTLDVRKMIEHLGSERIHTDGVHVRHKTFLPSGEFVGWHEKDNVYELYRINGEALGVTLPLYAVKCWCTSTDKEHWIWVESQYATDALTAIASTFRVHKNMIPHIKEIKRQGDVLLLELKQQVKPEGEVVPLTKDQYFNLLTAES